MKTIKNYIIAVVCCFMGVSFSIVPVNAINASLAEIENNTISISGIDYNFVIEENESERIVQVTSESGQTAIALYDKELEILSVCDCLVDIDEFDIDDNITTWYTLILSSTRYTLGPSVTGSAAALIAGLMAISVLPVFITSIIAFVTGSSLWGSTIYVTISECRSGLKMSSGTYAGKYKYWTNVRIECNDVIILDQDHSIYYA